MTYKTLRRLIAASLLCVSTAAWSATERCKLADSTSLPADHPRCLFYSGTDRYGDDDYEGAAAFWQRLVDSPSVPIEYEHLRTDAYSNLGYLTHRGLGVPRNAQRALELWTRAFHAGHDEASYHLCMALTNPRDSLYRPGAGAGYCKESLRRFGRLNASERKPYEDNMVRIKKRLR